MMPTVSFASGPFRSDCEIEKNEALKSLSNFEVCLERQKNLKKNENPLDPFCEVEKKAHEASILKESECYKNHFEKKKD